MNYIVDSIV